MIEYRSDSRPGDDVLFIAWVATKPVPGADPLAGTHPGWWLAVKSQERTFYSGPISFYFAETGRVAHMTADGTPRTVVSGMVPDITVADQMILERMLKRASRVWKTSRPNFHGPFTVKL